MPSLLKMGHSLQFRFLDVDCKRCLVRQIVEIQGHKPMLMRKLAKKKGLLAEVNLMPSQKEMVMKGTMTKGTMNMNQLIYFRCHS